MNNLVALRSFVMIPSGGNGRSGNFVTLASNATTQLLIIGSPECSYLLNLHYSFGEEKFSHRLETELSDERGMVTALITLGDVNRSGARLEIAPIYNGWSHDTGSIVLPVAFYKPHQYPTLTTERSY